MMFGEVRRKIGVGRLLSGGFVQESLMLAAATLVLLLTGCIGTPERESEVLKSEAWSTTLKADVVQEFSERLPQRLKLVAVNDPDEAEIRFLLGSGEVELAPMKNVRRVSNGYSFRERTSGGYVSVLRFGQLIVEEGFVRSVVALHSGRTSDERETINPTRLEATTAVGMVFDEGNRAVYYAFIDGLPSHRSVVGLVMAAIE